MASWCYKTGALRVCCLGFTYLSPIGNSSWDASSLLEAAQLFLVTFLMDIPFQLKDKPGHFSAVGGDQKLEQTTNELYQSAVIVSSGILSRSNISLNGIWSTTKWWLWKTCYENILVTMRSRFVFKDPLQVLSRLVHATCRFIQSHLCKIIFFQQKSFFFFLSFLFLFFFSNSNFAIL